MTENLLSIVDLSGYSFTGKSAYYDLLMEFDGYYSHSKEYEFDLLRIPGGLLDLRHALVDEWSPVRSSEAIRRFMDIVKKLGGERNLHNRLFGLGAHYDWRFPGFSEASENYVESLIDTRWNCDWPFAAAGRSALRIAIDKNLSRLGLLKEDTVYLSRMTKVDFDLKTRHYLQTLLDNLDVKNIKCLVTNNSFEPVNPSNCLEFFCQAKAIIIDRDPRDIYISAKNAEKVGNTAVGKAVTGETIDDFIFRFKASRITKNHNVSDVYRTNFEALVYDYENEVGRVIDFLEEDTSIHSQKQKLFDPKTSAKNVGQWKNLKDASLLSDAEYIEDKLGTYCLNL